MMVFCFAKSRNIQITPPYSSVIYIYLLPDGYPGTRQATRYEFHASTSYFLVQLSTTDSLSTPSHPSRSASMLDTTVSLVHLPHHNATPGHLAFSVYLQIFISVPCRQTDRPRYDSIGWVHARLCDTQTDVCRNLPKYTATDASA